MSSYERELIGTVTFDELWKYLWGEQIGIQYRGEERVSRDKYDALKSGVENKIEYNLEQILNESHSIWEDTEWGVSKRKTKLSRKGFKLCFKRIRRRNRLFEIRCSSSSKYYSIRRNIYWFKYEIIQT